jgi:hypothetical protein
MRHFLAVFAALAAMGLSAVPAQAASNTTVEGRGSTSSFFCGPNGQTVPAQLNFSATKNKGTISGNFNIFDPSFTQVDKFGNVTGGNVNHNSFNLTGGVTAFFCGTTNYFPNGAFGSFQLRGQCGTSVPIDYTDSLGERGTFIGTVAC